jgi:hypothetical protein
MVTLGTRLHSRRLRLPASSLTTPRRLTRLLAAVAIGIITGCGSGGSGGPTSVHTSRAAAPRPTGTPADPGAVSVIKGWSDALRRGDIRGAAQYFALPSLMINGPDANGQVVAVTIRTRTEAEAANASLPCGARLISADKRGRYVNALFRLTGRPGAGGGCGAGVGQTARTDFVITKRRIREWLRAPQDPGDNPGPQQGEPAPPSGGNSLAPTV